MQDVTSSNVSQVGYDSDAAELHVKYKSGGVYIYENVAPEQHAALLAAPSVGKHIHAHIKGAGYKSRKA